MNTQLRNVLVSTAMILEIIGGMTIYKDAELKTYLEQAGFHDVQIHKKKSWLCITARK